jgi:putative ABC transport system permease protein
MTMLFLRNLLRNKLRSALTLFGVASGVAVFVSIATITLDMRQQIGYMLSVYNTEVLILSRNVISPLRSRISQTRLDDLRREFGAGVAPMVMGTLHAGNSKNVLVLGIEPRLSALLPLIAGNVSEAGQGHIAMGVLLAEALQIRAGQRIDLAGREYIVQGIYRTGSPYLDDGLVADIAAAQTLLRRNDATRPFNAALVRTGSKAETARIMARIRTGYGDLRAMPTIEIAGTLQLLHTVELSSWIIAAIALIGAALVVANTLIMAVSERTRELGVLLAIGWTPWLILRMLLAETLALSSAGVVLGNLGAALMLWGMNQWLSAGPIWNIPTHLSAAATAGSAAAGLLVALSALIGPAIIIYRLQPATAIRHE